MISTKNAFLCSSYAFYKKLLLFYIYVLTLSLSSLCNGLMIIFRRFVSDWSFPVCLHYWLHSLARIILMSFIWRGNKYIQRKRAPRVVREVKYVMPSASNSAQGCQSLFHNGLVILIATCTRVSEKLLPACLEKAKHLAVLEFSNNVLIHSIALLNFHSIQ